MSAEDRLLQPAWLADGLARRLEAAALRMGALPDSARAAGAAARQVCQALTEGHVCLGLDELEPEEAGPHGSAAWRSLLLASGVVAPAQPALQPATHPLVLDDDDRLYLARYHAYEQRLAQRLLQASRLPVVHDEHALQRLRARLFEWFPPGTQQAPATSTPDWQMLAAALACRSRLTVISGGPGTGKTTTVVALLDCLLAEDPDCRIALAAPTGKAAARMLEALRERSARLPAASREALPRQASTVHRLLGSRADGRFTHDAQRPLALDVLVVDEASMLDLSLATHLLEAVPPHARIVLLGDRHQLAAVEAGAVFAEISADPGLSEPCRRALSALTGTPEALIAPAAPVRPSPLRDAAVWFTRSHRFAQGSGIGRLAQLVNAGDTSAVLAALATAPAGAVPGRIDADELLGPYQPFLQAVAETPHDVGRAIQAFGRYRVLCATRTGRQGVEAVNAALEARARAQLPAHPGEPSSPWYPGRPVIVRRNDYVLQLYNGDIGLALPDADGRLMVWFPGEGTGLRAVAPARLPAHDTCLAMTVHQAQGSEFDEVALVLPGQASAVLTRELVYTGLTRARERVHVHASAQVLEAALARQANRRSGLLARLQELGATGAA
ncbi:MAG: hypothetical protein RI988_803 [Pseudomonadota bacterium]|jgi:exodeoxyribonuclease V alpha subunit